MEISRNDDIAAGIVAAAHSAFTESAPHDAWNVVGGNYALMENSDGVVKIVS